MTTSKVVLRVVLGCFLLTLVFACKPKEKVLEYNMPFEATNLIYYAQPENIDTLLAFANHQDQIVFMEFVADWCLPCQVMEESTFSEPAVADFLNANFINYRVDYDTDEGKNLALLFQAEVLPALFFLDTRGRVLIKYNGQLGAQDMITMGQQALDAYEEEKKAKKKR